MRILKMLDKWRRKWSEISLPSKLTLNLSSHGSWITTQCSHHQAWSGTPRLSKKLYSARTSKLQGNQSRPQRPSRATKWVNIPTEATLIGIPANARPSSIPTPLISAKKWVVSRKARFLANCTPGEPTNSANSVSNTLSLISKWVPCRAWRFFIHAY